MNFKREATKYAEDPKMYMYLKDKTVVFLFKLTTLYTSKLSRENYKIFTSKLSRENYQIFLCTL